MNLHILNQSPEGSNVCNDMLQAISTGDAVILIEDAVYHALANSDSPLHSLTNSCHVLEVDINARGMEQRISDKFEVIDDSGFVSLCCQYKKTVSWF